MSGVIKAEFLAIYMLKKEMEGCARTASSLIRHADDLHLPDTAFTRVENAKTIQAAWKTVCEGRELEAEQLHKKFNAIATILGNVMEAYGVTDEEMAKAIARAERLGIERPHDEKL